MKLILDQARFDDMQIGLVRELVKAIRVKLIEAGLGGSELADATASIAFSVASMIDDTSGIESDDTEVHPYLAFRAGEDELIHCNENSYTHEFVYEVLKELFDE